ncbi:hypothetical protein BH23PLA1_BH23PLA1_09590 [soil metagenome]
MATVIDPVVPSEIPLKDVEHELDRQLKLAQGPGEAPVVRARMSNLIIYCDRPEDCAQIVAHVPDIVAIHPARVLLLIIDPAADPGRISASVQTRVHKINKGLRAFSEVVTLRTAAGSAMKLPFAVRRLLIGDLPTNLWFAARQPPVMAGTLLYELAEGASQVIYDSYGWPEPARGLTATASWLERFERSIGQGHYRIASDLTWRRLKPWRRLVAEALDPATAPGAFESVTEVLFDHGPHSVTSAWSLASWMSLRLAWQVVSVKVVPGSEVAWQFTSSSGLRSMRIRRIANAPRGIQWMRIGCTIGGQPGALNLAPVDDRRLKIEPEGIPGTRRTVTAPTLGLAELVGRQLSDRERDTVFRESMRVAQDLAISVLKQS